MAKETQEMKMHLFLVALVLAPIAPAPAAQPTTQECTAEILASIKAYCEHADSGNTLNLRDLHRSEAFGQVRTHLSAILDRAEQLNVGKSYAFSTLVWRSAFLFGTDREIERAFDVCWRETDPLRGSIAVYDMATVDGVDLPMKLLFSSEVSTEAISRFIYFLSDESPDAWGIGSYRPELENLFESESVAASVRIHAAFCLTKWPGESEALNQQVSQFLKKAAETDDRAAWLQFLIGISAPKPTRRSATSPTP
jgi:hypothetical protein